HALLTAETEANQKSETGEKPLQSAGHELAAPKDGHIEKEAAAAREPFTGVSDEPKPETRESDAKAADAPKLPITTGQPIAKISGIVRANEGQPAPQETVAVFARALRTETEIGRTITDPDGKFLIQYNIPNTSIEHRLGTNLNVSVLKAD